MKKGFIIIIATLYLVACANNDKKTNGNTADTTGKKTDTAGNVTTPSSDPANYTTIEWIDSTVKDLGKLKQGQEVEITWRFRNSGNKSLVIENVTAGCGCTIPEKPEQPFAPGQEGVIKAKFNGSGSGMISKNVTVTANTTPQTVHQLLFTGEIKEK